MRTKPVVLAAIVLGALGLILLFRGSCSPSTVKTYTDEGELLLELGALTTYACEQCDAETVDSFRPTPFRCATCGQEAVVESVRYECAACGKPFEAFRRRSVMSSDGKRPVAFEAKPPGGSWQRGTKPPLKCPHCGNEDAAKLHPAAPKPPAPPPGTSPFSGLEAPKGLDPTRKE